MHPVIDIDAHTASLALSVHFMLQYLCFLKNSRATTTGVSLAALIRGI